MYDRKKVDELLVIKTPNLSSLTSFLCFSVLPCLQMLPGVCYSLKQAVVFAYFDALTECSRQYEQAIGVTEEVYHYDQCTTGDWLLE